MSLREWLANTSDVSRTSKDYDLWAKQTNEHRTDTALVGVSASVLKAMVLPWQRCLAVARGDTDLPTARAAYLEDLITRSGPLRLTSVSGIALIFGIGQNHAAALAEADTFPSPVVKFGRTTAWYFDDIVAHHAGHDLPCREPYELQNQLCGSGEVSRLLAMSPATLVSGIHRKAWSWVPPPAGAVGNHHYWNRDAVQEWRSRRDARRSDDD